MTIECYYDTCRYHGVHGGEEGPFCFEEECRATEHELVLHGRIRKLLFPDPPKFNVADIDTYFKAVNEMKVALESIPTPSHYEVMANPTMWGILKDLTELSKKIQDLESDLNYLQNTTREVTL